MNDPRAAPTNKDLHVLVAEALGWTDIRYDAEFVGGWEGMRPHPCYRCDVAAEVPRFDTDWRATGPLIEKFGLELSPSETRDWLATKHETQWQYVQRRATAPLVAVCDLILALKAAGKL